MCLRPRRELSRHFATDGVNVITGTGGQSGGMAQPAQAWTPSQMLPNMPNIPASMTKKFAEKRESRKKLTR